MLKTSRIPKSHQDYIIEKLKAIELNERVRILWAIESGSRAWGFPSIDSDYDVRFIYVRTLNDYIGIQNLKDVIETPTIFHETLGNPIDMNGWDVRKALQLGLKSNPVLVEWLASPIVYIRESTEMTPFVDFIHQEANIDTLYYHYRQITQKSWEQIQQSNISCKLKTYCYAIRSTLAIEWLRHRKAPPPMDLKSLYQGLVLDIALEKFILELVQLKKESREGDTIERNPILDAFIVSALQHADMYQIHREEKNAPNIKKANDLFRHIINLERLT